MVTKTKSPLFIDGASGYLAAHTINKLSCSGYPIRALLRPTSCNYDEKLLLSSCQMVLKGELESNNDIIRPMLSGAYCAIHLIGSIAPKKGESLDGSHLEQTKHLTNICKKTGVPKIVMISALGTKANAKNEYHKTKWEAEEYLRQSGLNWVILRPSLIIGKTTGTRDSKLVNRYRDLMQKRKSIPLIAGGKNLLQPVFVDDLASAVANVATSNTFDKKTIEIGGPEIITMHDFINCLMSIYKIKKPIKDIPPLLASLTAFYCQLTQEIPLVSLDQVKLSQENNVCNNNELQSIIGINPATVNQALSTYLNNN